MYTVYFDLFGHFSPAFNASGLRGQVSGPISEFPRGATGLAYADRFSEGRVASKASAPAGWGISRAVMVSPASLVRRACDGERSRS